MGGARADAEHVHRRFREVFGAIGPHKNHGGAAVTDEAAITHTERIEYTARIQDIGNAERIAHFGGRVQLRPFTRCNCHFGQLLGRGAVLVHVTCRRQGIGLDRIARLVNAFDCLRLRRRHETTAAVVAAVADQRHVAEAVFQRHRCRQQRIDEYRTTQVGTVHEIRLDAKIFGHCQRRQLIDKVGRKNAIDIADRQPGVCQRVMHGFAHDLHVAVATEIAETAEAHANNCGSTAQGLLAREYLHHSLLPCSLL